MKVEKRPGLILFLSFIGFLFLIQSAVGGDSATLLPLAADPSQEAQLTPVPLASLVSDVLAKAQPDECYTGLAATGPVSVPPCASGIPKVNQAYVWSMTRAGDQIWFGTMTNTQCVTMGGFLAFNRPYETDSWACQFGGSPFSPPLPDFLGDWRPARIYSYNTTTRELVDRTPTSPNPAADLIGITLGLRSAGRKGNIVLLAGTSLQPVPPETQRRGINIFAFAADSGVLLGAANLPQFSDIRKWLLVNGVLYAAVQNSEGGGSVLRWRGRFDPARPGRLFRFEVVGNLDSMGSEIAFHQGRLFVNTWPGSTGALSALAGLYMSPRIPKRGLTQAHAGGWTKVWQVDQYEPDPVVARTYGGGTLASFDGYLYWGTMHVPFLAASAATEAHDKGFIDLDANGNGELDKEEVRNTVSGTQRAISIYRGRGFGTDRQKIQLLYGDRYLSVYDPAQKAYTLASDAAHQNKMDNPRPKWGASGFGNPYNAYTWSMAVFKRKLYIGTFDWSYLLVKALPVLGDIFYGDSVLAQLEIAFELARLTPGMIHGADLYRIESSGGPAVAESLDGVGNFTNYGIRNMVTDRSSLYLGIANPMNLLTNPNDSLPEGGWELIELN